MRPLVRISQTGYWIPAFAGMTDNALEPSDHVARCPLRVVFVGDCVTSAHKQKGLCGSKYGGYALLL